MSVQTTTAMTHPLVRYALVLALLAALAYSLYMPHMTPAGYASYMMTILLQVSVTAILAVGVNLLLSAIPALAGSEALRPLLATILSAFLGTLLFGRSPDPAACPQPAATGPDGEAAPGSAAERGDS